MDPFQMVVLIVLISVGAGVMNNYFKAKANREADGVSDAKMEAMMSEVERLKDRVRVLEKITTDSDHQLSQEIRKLA